MMDGGFDHLSDFDEDDEQRTVVDSAFWDQPKVPDYPALATFGRFEILGRLARGGMAEVYLAREWDEDGKARHLVVKRVLPEMEDQPELLDMFQKEGAIAVRLYHPNVCHVYECGVIDGITFMALEWVWGPSLQQVVERAASRGGCVPWPVAIEIVSRAAAALHYVHDAKGTGGRPLNIIHRDVSPHNIMMSWTGGVKLLDFGIAKTSSQEMTTGGATVGKYGYMSPEQARSQRVDRRSDVFALGVVLYEALTGQPLYDRPTLLETLTAVTREPVPSLRAERPELPAVLEHIVTRALAKDPAQRFQSAGEFRAALQQVLRSNDQVVTDQRVALTLDSLYSKADKQPLRGKPQATASFSALSAQGAAQVLNSSEVVTFDHSRPSVPVPIGAMPAKRAPVPVFLLFVGIVFLGLFSGAIVALLGYMLLR